MLRHYYASQLIAGGLDVIAVAALLGDTVEEVQRTYAHILPNHAERARAAVEATFGMGHQHAQNTPRTPETRRQTGSNVSPLTRTSHG